jgi:hypothetical protein
MVRLLPIIAMVVASCISFVSAYTAPKQPNVLQKALLKVGMGKHWREQVVQRYFNGVQTQNLKQIVSCFPEEGTQIRDVCGVSNTSRLATPEELGQRCMEFLRAHSDTRVLFHYP